jgi:hypothetical protein
VGDGRAPGGRADRSWLNAVVGPTGVTATGRGESDHHVWYGVVLVVLVWIISRHYNY